MKRPRVDVNLEELDQIIDRGTHGARCPRPAVVPITCQLARR